MQLEHEMNKRLTAIKAKLKKRETELKTISDELKFREEELVKSRTEMESMSLELVQTNHAMSVLAKKIDGKKAALEMKVHTTITTKIMPIIRNLEADEKIKKYWPEINSMAEHLNSITTKNNLYHKTISVLTETEMKIAAMVKNGMTTAKIADLMFISKETVKVHRKNIRKKLKINNTKNRLSEYLTMVMGE